MTGKAKLSDPRPLGNPNSWARTPGTYIAGQANIDGTDKVAIEMERRWGCGRLRLLVDTALREKFDRQRYLYNQAIWHGELEDVRRECSRMTKAWQVLSQAAEALGAAPLTDQHWEVVLADGSVAAVVADPDGVGLVPSEGRQVAVYTMDEIGELLSKFPDIVQAKRVFPGAEVTEVR